MGGFLRPKPKIHHREPVAYIAEAHLVLIFQQYFCISYIDRSCNSPRLNTIRIKLPYAFFGTDRYSDLFFSFAFHFIPFPCLTKTHMGRGGRGRWPTTADPTPRYEPMGPAVSRIHLLGPVNSSSLRKKRPRPIRKLRRFAMEPMLPFQVPTKRQAGIDRAMGNY